MQVQLLYNAKIQNDLFKKRKYLTFYSYFKKNLASVYESYVKNHSILDIIIQVII